MKTRKENLEKSRNELIENVRLGISRTVSQYHWDEDELYLSSIFLDFPELLTYIRNIRVLENNKLDYPQKIEEIYIKYLDERKEGHYIALPEICLFLCNIGFNLKLKETQNLANYLSSITDADQVINFPIETLNIKTAVMHIHPYPSNLQKQLFGEKNIKEYSNVEILSILSSYILSHIENFIEQKKETEQVHL